MPSIIHIHGEGVSPCGYCKVDNVSVGESVSYGITTEAMSVADYERLMLIGWRRSGTYFYKPVMHKTCCPAYTIRLNAKKYQISRSQRKDLRNMNKYLQTQREQRNMDQESLDSTEVSPIDSNLTITTSKASFSEEKYQLYRKYQISTHYDNPDEITAASYRRFLVDSPLIDNVTHPTCSLSNTLSAGHEREILTSASTSPSSTSSLSVMEYGTYHQEYRIYDVLIAVGVVDILPSGLSSVYLYYDPAFKFLSMGKYTAIREIDYCTSNNLEYYYMGYYIHTCPKMRYKGDFKPSELLCPTTMQWYDLKACIPYLDSNKFTPLKPELAEERLRMITNSNLAIYHPMFPSPAENYHLRLSILVGELPHRRRILVQHLPEQGQYIVKQLYDQLAAYCGHHNLERFLIAL